MASFPFVDEYYICPEFRSKGYGLSLTLMKLQEEKTKQTGILHLTHFDPLILNSALDQVLRNRIWMRSSAYQRLLGVMKQ